MGEITDTLVKSYALGEHIMQTPQRRQSADLDLQKMGLEVRALQYNLDARNKMLEIYSNSAAGPTDSPLDRASKIADAMVGAGLYEEGFEALVKVADTANKTAEAIIKEREQRNAELDRAYGMVASVNNQEDWEWAVRAVVTENPALREDPAAMEIFSQPFQPRLKNLLLNAILTVKDQAQIEASRAAADASRANAERDRFYTSQVLPAEIDVKEARADSLRKAGGEKEEKAARKDRIKRAADMVRGTFAPGATDKGSHTAWANSVGRDIADRAEDLLDSGAADTEDEALDMAIEDEARKGTFAGRTRVKGGKGSRENPVDVSTVQLSAVTAGTWVKNSKGKVGFFDGKKILTTEEYEKAWGITLPGEKD